MAKSAYQIKLDYKKAKKVAEELDDIANNLNKYANEDFANCLKTIEMNWTSESSKDYSKKANKVLGNLNDLKTNIKKAAEVIRTNAAKTYSAELKAIEIAKERR